MKPFYILFDNIPVEFYALDTDLRYIMQNAASFRQYGNVVGKRIIELDIPGEIKEQWIEQDDEVLKGKIIQGEYEAYVNGKKDL